MTPGLIQLHQRVEGVPLKQKKSSTIHSNPDKRCSTVSDHPRPSYFVTAWLRFDFEHARPHLQRQHSEEYRLLGRSLCKVRRQVSRHCMVLMLQCKGCHGRAADDILTHFIFSTGKKIPPKLVESKFVFYYSIPIRSFLSNIQSCTMSQVN